MPKLETVDRRAIARAAKGLAPMLARRVGYLGGGRGASGERMVRTLIAAKLDAIRDDDLVDDIEDVVWARLERSGLVLVGIGARAYIVARAAPRGGRAARLLVR